MKVATEELERCETLMTIELEPKKEKELLTKAARRIAKQVSIPGFRRGKAPFNTIARRFGLETIQQEALEHSVENIVDKALEQAELEPHSRLQIEEVSWSPLTIQVKVPGPPKVELGNYRDLRLDAEPVVVEETEVDKSLVHLQEQYATWVPVERPTQIGDLVSMHVIQKDEDEIIQDEEIEYDLTPPEKSDEEEAESSSDEPDFITPLLGLSAGEEKTFTLDYPESYQEERFAGKTFTVTVNIKGVKEEELDPLDDEFARYVSDFETLEELKDDLRANLRESKQENYDQELGEKMLGKIVEEAPLLEWSPAFEEFQLDQELRRYENQLTQARLNLEDYLSLQGQTIEEFREGLREAVVNRIKESLALEKIIELEKLKVSQSELLEKAKQIATMVNDENAWQHLLANEAYQASLEREVLGDKAIERLARIAEGEVPDLAEEDEPEEATPSEAIVAEEEETDKDPVVTQT